MKNFRLIPRLEVKSNNLIKGIQMEGLRIVGNPVSFLKNYCSEGADEIFYDDIVASLYNRKYNIDLIKKMSLHLNIPLIVGGGIKDIGSASEIFNCGADRISINTAALKNPKFIEKIASTYGSQSIAVQIQIKKLDDNYEVFSESGRERHNIKLFDWINIAQNSGAGEIIFIFIDRDGMKGVADTNLLKNIREKTKIQIIYGGGISSLSDIKKIHNIGFNGACMSRALHFGEMSISSIKNKIKLIK